MSARKARFSGLLVPITIVFGVCVLLLMPNLIMHASLGGVPSAVGSAFGPHASSDIPAGGAVESPAIVR
ncbi:MAG: hypothetical protein AAF637_05680 [Pseudomonadota bacterium]